MMKTDVLSKDTGIVERCSPTMLRVDPIGVVWDLWIQILSKTTQILCDIIAVFNPFFNVGEQEIWQKNRSKVDSCLQSVFFAQNEYF